MKELIVDEKALQSQVKRIGDLITRLSMLNNATQRGALEGTWNMLHDVLDELLEGRPVTLKPGGRYEKV